MILKKIVWLVKVKEKALMKLLDKMLRYKTMLLYCLKCKKYWKSSNNKTMLLSQCAIFGTKKSRFMKKQEASGILISLGL